MSRFSKICVRCQLFGQMLTDSEGLKHWILQDRQRQPLQEVGKAEPLYFFWYVEMSPVMLAFQLLDDYFLDPGMVISGIRLIQIGNLGLIFAI
jgi:hypothetical protein